MGSMVLATFRAGIEALLIAAVVLSYLHQTARMSLVPWAYAGISAAVVLSAILGVVLVPAGGLSPLAEAWLALLAAVPVLGCIVLVIRNDQRMASGNHERIEPSGRAPRFARLALFAFMLLMIGRQAVGVATTIAALAIAGDLPQLLAGAVTGIAAAGALAWVCARYGKRVKRSLFFRLTTVFAVLFSVLLLAGAVHEFTEAGALPIIDNEQWHLATEAYGPEGLYGHWLSYSLLLAPLGFLIGALARRTNAPGSAAPSARIEH